MIVEITKDNIEEVLANNKSVILDFWAPWCGPCRMVGPVLDELESEIEGLVIGKVNVDNEEELSMKFKISAIPAIYIYKDNVLTNNVVGFKSKEELKELL